MSETLRVVRVMGRGTNGRGNIVTSVSAGTGVTVTGTASAPIINASGGGLSTLHEASINITASQIKAMDGVPIVLVAAQGANTIIVPVVCSIIIDLNGKVGYTVVGLSDMQLYYGDPYTNALVTGVFLQKSGLHSAFGASGINILNGGVFRSSDVQDSGDMANLPLVLTHRNGSNFTDGTADAVVKLLYWVMQTV